MDLHTICVINMKRTNSDIEASNVSGIVTLDHEQEMAISSCNQTKEVIIYNGECTDMFAKSCIFAPNFVILKFNIFQSVRTPVQVIKSGHLIGQCNHVTTKHGSRGSVHMLHSKQSLRHSVSLRWKDLIYRVALFCRGLLLFTHEKELFWLPACECFVSWQDEVERAQLKAVFAHNFKQLQLFYILDVLIQKC